MAGLSQKRQKVNTDGRTAQTYMSESAPSNSLSLAKLLYERLSLSDEIEAQEGEITEEQDLIWQNQELAIKDKVDTYGYVLTELNAELEKIKELKREATARITGAAARVQSNIDRLKRRLNFLSEGSPLRGHIYSFHPYLSVKRQVDISKVEDNLIDIVVQLKEADWKELLNSAEVVPEFKVLKREAKVSQLPEIHPALTTKRTASVRVT